MKRLARSSIKGSVKRKFRIKQVLISTYIVILIPLANDVREYGFVYTLPKQLSLIEKQRILSVKH